MICLKEYLMGRIKPEELSPELRANAEELLRRVNIIRAQYGKPMKVSSGYRSPAQNAAAGGAKKSNHMICKAIDIADPNRELQAWLLQNVELLEKVGLWCEDFDYSPSWAHLQIVAPKSGKRFFKP